MFFPTHIFTLYTDIIYSRMLYVRHVVRVCVIQPIHKTADVFGVVSRLHEIWTTRDGYTQESPHISRSESSMCIVMMIFCKYICTSQMSCFETEQKCCSEDSDSAGVCPLVTSTFLSMNTVGWSENPLKQFCYCARDYPLVRKSRRHMLFVVSLTQSSPLLSLLSSTLRQTR